MKEPPRRPPLVGDEEEWKLGAAPAEAPPMPSSEPRSWKALMTARYAAARGPEEDDDDALFLLSPVPSTLLSRSCKPARDA